MGNRQGHVRQRVGGGGNALGFIAQHIDTVPPGPVAEQALAGVSAQAANTDAGGLAGSQRPGQLLAGQQWRPIDGAGTGLDHQRPQGRIAAFRQHNAVDLAGGGGADDHAQVLRVGDAVQRQQALR